MQKNLAYPDYGLRRTHATHALLGCSSTETFGLKGNAELFAEWRWTSDLKSKRAWVSSISSPNRLRDTMRLIGPNVASHRNAVWFSNCD